MVCAANHKITVGCWLCLAHKCCLPTNTQLHNSVWSHNPLTSTHTHTHAHTHTLCGVALLELHADRKQGVESNSTAEFGQKTAGDLLHHTAIDICCCIIITALLLIVEGPQSTMLLEGLQFKQFFLQF